ncbi:hypothetical protein [Aeromicrobium choanae]|uniref:Uncharacterized protein n=1 Tax=Aeromicrobium choanae TaxID=1736691 RepID=A0A1T4YYS0_9ACTN|nr:hypothetical protein [Aeromicrobium choanae]SKB06960.1 hypothetical protein SAMN06295964_1516 [Aeromicrobium choanae]
MSLETQQRSYWGRARFGGGTGVLLASCVGIALAVSGAMAAYALTGLEGTRQDVVLVFASLALPSVFALAWVALVDQASLRDAVDRPEETIEVQWVRRAQSGAFTDLLLLLGVTLVVGVFVDLDVSAHVALTVVIAFAMADAGLRMLWLKRRDG